MSRPILRLKELDDRTIRIGVRLADELARNLTDELIEFQAAPKLGSGSATITKSEGAGIEIVDAALGLIDLVFEPQDTAGVPSTLLWEIRVTDIFGKVITLDWAHEDPPEHYGVLLIERAMTAAG